MSLDVMEAPEVCKPKEPKVRAAHPWAGRMVVYWRETAPGELSPLPAMLLAPHRVSEGWDLNFWRVGHMQGRQDVKFSEKPKACCWTWGAEGAPRPKGVKV